MRASVLRDGRMVYRDDVPDPVPGPGQVLVAVRSCGICGSDLHFAAHGAEVLELSNEMSSGAGGMTVDLHDDVFMGHEFSAEILEAGPGTDTHPAGTLVTSIPVLLSGTDVEAIVYSNTTVGGYAERMLLSAPLLLRVPNGLDPQHASLAEPMAVGLHAVNKSGITPGEPALVLSIPLNPTDTDDGLLTSSEVAQLKLNADWVVLSACNTMAGDKPGAEALSGLARSFFYAGARSLLVTHWAVDSAAATRLTTSTFDLLKSEPGIGRAEALRRAMLAYLGDTSSPRNAYPAVWGPFALIGEGASR